MNQIDPNDDDPAAVLARAMAEPDDADDADPIPDEGVVVVDMTLASGAEFKGAFHYRLPLTVAEKIRIGNRACDLRGGRPPEQLDAASAELAHRAAYLSMAITKAPPWATSEGVKGAPGVPNIALAPEVIADGVFEKVWAHANTFRKRNRDRTAAKA